MGNPKFDLQKTMGTSGNAHGSPMILIKKSVAVYRHDGHEEISTFLHENTRIPGGEGLLVDTGAVTNMTGQDFATRMDAEARA